MSLPKIDSSFAAGVRSGFRLMYDEHVAYKPSDRSWYKISKLHGRAHFKELAALPIYGSITHAREGRLSGVIKTDARDWWFSAEVQPGSETDLAYRVWEAGMQWCGRVLPRLETAIELPEHNIEITVKGVFAPPDRILRSPLTTPLLEVTSGSGTALISLNAEFFNALAQPDNQGEKTLVRAICEAILHLCAVSRHLDIDALVAEFVPDRYARFVHLFMGQSPRDNLHVLRIQPPQALEERELCASFLGIGLELGYPGRHTLSAKKPIQKFLHGAVDELWKRIRQHLLQLERQECLTTILGNMEALAEEGEIWKRTAAALNSVYRDQSDVQDAVHKQTGERSRTALTSRVLVEMAVCECPLGRGKQIGRSEYSELMGLCLGLLLAANNSDAIEYGLVDCRLDIWPNGEFAVPEDFVTAVMKPYQQGHSAQDFRNSVAAYPTLFAEHKTKPVGEVFDARFLKAWYEEFGFSIEDLIRCEETLIELALNRKARIVTVSPSDLARALNSNGVSGEHSTALINSLSLRFRQQWNHVPAEFEERDFMPWKFSRRLSLLRRPLLQLGEDLLYAAGLVHDAFSFTVGGAFGGTLDQKTFFSDAMKSWIGEIANRKGHEFNKTICEAMRSLGFRARDSVQMSEFGVPRLGDVDVLAVSKDGSIVVLLECKQLRFARTVGEIGEQLRRFSGRPGDELDKHIQRAEWFERQRKLVSPKLGLKPSFTLRKMLVTSTLVPIAFSNALPIPKTEITPAADLELAMKTVLAGCPGVPGQGSL
ncbi:MAG TPA: hypothetical protein VFB04_00915 [Terriglobales bacterium]|nr:hypothetical protein [Terriglobales bacterium]